jgi:hypothetical protein
MDLGFDWSTTDPRHVSWDERFEQLRQFKVSLKLPRTFDAMPLLTNA